MKKLSLSDEGELYYIISALNKPRIVISPGGRK